jgi:hypothetical protein
MASLQVGAVAATRLPPAILDRLAELTANHARPRAAKENVTSDIENRFYAHGRYSRGWQHDDEFGAPTRDPVLAAAWLRGWRDEDQDIDTIADGWSQD